jgi:hypothetical protein
MVGAVGIKLIAQIEGLTTTLFSSAVLDSRLKAADHPITSVNRCLRTGLLTSVADRQPITPCVQPAEFLPSMEQQFSPFLRAVRHCGVSLAFHNCATLTSNPVRHRLKQQ